MKIVFSLGHQKITQTVSYDVDLTRTVFNALANTNHKHAERLRFVAPSPDASALEAYGSRSDPAWLFLVLSIHVLTNRMLNECTFDSVFHPMLDAATELQQNLDLKGRGCKRSCMTVCTRTP